MSTYYRIGAIALLVIATFVPRLAGLGHQLTVDEPLWEGRGAAFIQAFSTGRFEKTLVAGQPGVTTAWLIGLSESIGTLAAHQAAIATATGVLVLAVTYFLVRLWGFRWGMIAGFFLALDPYLLGHSRLAHTDALLTLFYLTSLVSCLSALAPERSGESPIQRYVVVSGIFAGLGLLTKLFALILFPTVAAIFLITALRSRLPRVVFLRLGLLWIATATVTVYVLWPALWGHAGTVFDYLTSRVEIHAGGTRSLETTSAWWYYARETLFRLTPISTILLIPGLWGLMQRRDRLRPALAWLVPAGIVFAIVLSISAHRSDRYILITHLTLVLLSIFGLKIVVQWARQQFWLKYTAWFLLPTVSIAFLAIDAARLHPYYLAHYNRLYPVERDHKLGWGEGLEVAAQYIQRQHPGASVASYYNRVFDYFYAGPSTNLSGDTNADYLVVYRSMFERGPDHPDTDLTQQYIWSGRYKPEHVITINNLPYVWIFKNE